MAIYGCKFGDDSNTKYYSKWEVCEVEDVNGDIITVECDTIIREAVAAYDHDLKPGDFVEVRTDYEEYTTIQD